MRAIIIPVVLSTLALGACNTTGGASNTSALQTAVQDVKNMTPEQKYQVACNAADGLILAYRAFVAEKQSPAVNSRVEAAYASVQPFCANKPESYATALVSLVQAVNAFKAALPKAA